MLVIEIRDGELLDRIEQSAREHGITDAAIVTLIGAVDSFRISTMPADDATKDIITDYDLPAEMSGTGDVVEGKVQHLESYLAADGIDLHGDLLDRIDAIAPPRESRSTSPTTCGVGTRPRWTPRSAARTAGGRVQGRVAQSVRLARPGPQLA